MSEVPQKRCTGACGKLLLATTEFFGRSKGGKYGVTSECKECRNARERKPPVANGVPEGYKRCTGPCGQEYPATPEYWHRNKQQRSGLNPRCKKCVKDYNKDYYSRPEIQEHMQEYYSRTEVQKHIKAYHKEYRSRPEIQEHMRAWRRNYSRHYSRDYNKRPEVQERRRKLFQKAYHDIPGVREKYIANGHRRRARNRAVKGTHNPQQIQDQLKRQKHKCYYCQTRLPKSKGKYIYHVDHTFPISRVAGSDIPANDIGYLVLACPTCNRSKGDKFPWEWAEGGRLL